MDAILRGLSDEWAQNVDEWVVDDVTKYLFKSPNRDFGFDLISLNVLVCHLLDLLIHHPLQHDD